MTNVNEWMQAVWDSDLTAREKYIAAVLRSFMTVKQPYCFPSQSSIALRASMSARTAVRGLKGLEQKGWIWRERGAVGKSSMYHIARFDVPDMSNGQIPTSGKTVTRNQCENLSSECANLSENIGKSVTLSKPGSKPIINNQRSTRSMSNQEMLTDRSWADGKQVDNGN